MHKMENKCEYSLHESDTVLDAVVLANIYAGSQS